MREKKYIWIHIAAWLSIYIYLVTGTYFFPQNRLERSSPAYISLLHASYLLSQVVTFYFCYLLVYPNFLKRKKLVLGAIGAIASPLVFVLARFLLEETFFPAVFGFRNYGDDTAFSWYIIDNIFRGLPTIAVSAVIWGAQQAYYKERENKQLRDEKRKAELAFLKTQINPHFLFNTLNYMYALAYPVSEKLGSAVIRLSQLMRYMLTETEDDKVPLQKEMEYIHNYIEVYRMLFEDRFYIQFSVEGDPEGRSIASLLLVPFFENAFKHGVVNDPSRPVMAKLVITDGHINFTMKNTINPYQKDHSTGIGLPNVKRRLELLYPNAHELTITSNGSEYETRLSIEL